MYKFGTELDSQGGERWLDTVTQTPSWRFPCSFPWVPIWCPRTSLKPSQGFCFPSTLNKWPWPCCPVMHMATRPEGSSMTVLKARGWQKWNKHGTHLQQTSYEILFNHWQLWGSHRRFCTPAPVAQAILYPHYPYHIWTCLLLKVQTENTHPSSACFISFRPVPIMKLGQHMIHTWRCLILDPMQREE